MITPLLMSKNCDLCATVALLQGQSANLFKLHISAIRIGYEGLFGLSTVLPRHTEVVLTGSEFDAMAVNQATGLPALSLPKGDSTLPLRVRIGPPFSC